jgi:NAD(P)-dependent dehydrogenase (short-subunit alcohol dehydrogenase family)
MKKYYENKVAAVTGGASGIGLALVEGMLGMGAKAVTIADINEENLNRHLVRLSEAYPGKVQGVKTDVTSETDVKAMVDAAVAFGGGRIDLLFNNAGLALFGTFEDQGNGQWEKAFAVNFYGALYGVRAALPHMKAQGSGHIANTASGMAYVHVPYQSMYAATKSALLGLTTSLRYEYWDEGIRFSTVIPGSVATAIWGDYPIPDTAITPAESAAGILRGTAENQRVIFVTDEDREACLMTLLGAAYVPHIAKQVDEHLLGVARARKAGNLSAL